jgi:hypothetical protein
MEVRLRFDSGLNEKNTWRLRGVVLEARVQIAAAPEVTLEVSLRRHAPKVSRPGAKDDDVSQSAFVSRVDEDTWRTGPVQREGLPLVALVLENCPSDISKLLTDLGATNGR